MTVTLDFDVHLRVIASDGTTVASQIGAAYRARMKMLMVVLLVVVVAAGGYILYDAGRTTERACQLVDDGC